MSSYRRYRALILLNPVLLLLYATVALPHLWLPTFPRQSSDAVFPFFDWNLFSSPRKQGRLYTVRITEVREPGARGASLVGQTLADPRAVGFLRDVRFQKTATALARAHWRKQDAEVERMRTMLGNFLRPYGVTAYELVLLDYDPLAYYSGSEVPTEDVIAAFALGPEQ